MFIAANSISKVIKENETRLMPAVHVSGGNTTHLQERKQLYLQHLVFITPLLLPAPTYLNLLEFIR